MIIIAIHDRAAETYQNPIVRPTAAAAVREVHDLLKQDEKMAEHAEDYTLVQLGTFDFDSGRITPQDPKVIIDFTSCKE